MNDSPLMSLEQIRAFVAASGAVEFAAKSRREMYGWIEQTLVRLEYAGLGRSDKGVVKGYIATLSGLKRAQVTRLIGRYRKLGKVPEPVYARRTFPARYTAQDVQLLAYVDQAHGNLSGPATRRILQREYHDYPIAAYQRLAGISSAQIYRFCKTAEYRRHHLYVQPTRPTQVAIGKRIKPDPHGQPGWIRIDTVHQGDLNGVKGVYHINAVDEVTQWQVVGTVERISEAFLLPLLQAMIEQFPFRILNFHSDNGSEFINKNVHQLLDKLRIEQSKSRPRQSGDNALVEAKNGAVIRKHFGYLHIASQHADAIDQFQRQHLNPYLNFHRPCGIPELRTLAKGKLKRVYRQWETPWQILQNLTDFERFLRPGVTAAQLQQCALAESDTEAALAMQKAKRDLFTRLRRLSA